MIIPVKCFTCGMVLADKYRFYVQEVRKKKIARDGMEVNKVLYLTKEFHEKTTIIAIIARIAIIAIITIITIITIMTK